MVQPQTSTWLDNCGRNAELLAQRLAVLQANHANGWSGLITPYGKKAPLLKCCVGFSGYSPENADPDLYPEWCQANRFLGFNVAARLPEDAIGLDIDHGYLDRHGHMKTGLDTLRGLEEMWGPLPPTYRVTARPYESGSGIRLYRVDSDRWVWPGDAELADIDINDHNHRYVMVPPSIHHTGRRYRLYDPDGNEIVFGILPPTRELAQLP